MRPTYLLWGASAALCLAADVDMKRQTLGPCSSPSEPFCCARDKFRMPEAEDDGLGMGREVYDDTCKSLPFDS